MKFKRLACAVTCAAALVSMPAKETLAGANPFIGEIMWVGYNFCPRGWTEADGQLLPISENSALFSLYGTTYGGDGRTTFALPDLRGRVSIHTGQGPGLSDYSLGQKSGLEVVTLTANEIPAHNHTLNVSGGAVDKNAAGSILGSPKQKIYDAPVAASTTLASSAISDSGGGMSHENRPPYLTLRACIALTGVYPSRD